MTPSKITPIPASSAGDAIAILQAARNAGLPASYHPHGGLTEKKYTPVIHTVYVEGDANQVRAIRIAMAQKAGRHA